MLDMCVFRDVTVLQDLPYSFVDLYLNVICE
jgi:hypothetical protein